MDPVTHTLAGATMARAGLDRRTPLATAALLIGANAPDIDVVTAFGGVNTSLAWRRGWSHGPLAMLLLPFVVAGVLLAWDRWFRRTRSQAAVPARARELLALAAAGVLSHPALDWLNTYGIRLLMPFNNTWFHGDSVFIIDPWLWLMLAAGLFASRSAHPASRRASWFARISASTAISYIAAMVALSTFGERVGWQYAQASGVTGIEEVLYSPQPANPFKADLVVRTGEAYHTGTLEWQRTGAIAGFTGIVIPRGDWSAPAVQRARETPAARKYLIWSQFPYVRVDVSGADTTVFFGDVRYRTGLAGSLNGMTVTLPRAN